MREHVEAALERAVEQELRWGLIEQAAAAIPASGHEWDDDPAAWVQRQRRGDQRRGG